MKLNHFIKTNKFINFLIENLYKEKTPILGRWCHISMNNCNNKVILLIMTIIINFELFFL
jgi:hypothetical protein